MSITSEFGTTAVKDMNPQECMIEIWGRWLAGTGYLQRAEYRSRGTAGRDLASDTMYEMVVEDMQSWCIMVWRFMDSNGRGYWRCESSTTQASRCCEVWLGFRVGAHSSVWEGIEEIGFYWGYSLLGFFRSEWSLGGRWNLVRDEMYLDHEMRWDETVWFGTEVEM